MSASCVWRCLGAMRHPQQSTHPSRLGFGNTVRLVAPCAQTFTSILCIPPWLLRRPSPALLCSPGSTPWRCGCSKGQRGTGCTRLRHRLRTPSSSSNSSLGCPALLHRAHGRHGRHVQSSVMGVRKVGALTRPTSPSSPGRLLALRLTLDTDARASVTLSLIGLDES